MRIRSLHIDSFGKLNHVHVNDINEGLTVITGDNESGKTTTMEFMRRTMFPASRRKDVYPTPMDSDKGSLELESDGGITVILERDGKKVAEKSGKPLPSEMFSIDTDAYRSLFAMDLNDLVEKAGINSARQKFLTIPGGDNVPKIIDNLKDPMKALMSEERLGSKNAIKLISDRIVSLGAEIEEAKKANNEYDRLSKELQNLEEERRKLTNESGAVAEKKERYKVLKSQVINIEAYERLSDRKRDIDYSSSITDEMIDKFNKASARRSELENGPKNDGIEQMPEEKVQRMRSLNKSVNGILNDTAKADRIAAVKEEISSLNGQKTAVRNVPITTVQRTSKDDGIMMYLTTVIVGIALVAGGFVMSQMFITGIGALLVATGIGLYLLKSGKSIRNASVQSESKDVSTEMTKIDKQIESRMKELEELESETVRVQRELKEFLTNEGIEYKGLSLGVITLTGMIATADSMKARSELIEKTKDEIITLNQEMDSIAEPYGGKDKFVLACRDRSELINTVEKMNTIRTTVETAVGVTMEDAKKELETSSPIETVNTNAFVESEMIGKLTKQMKDIRLNNDVGVKENELNAKNAELIDKAKEWAVLAMQGTLIDRSCTELYSKMQPSVIKTANRYLGIMTNGRYEIISDPRMAEIMIRDTTGLKKDGEWSSGLRDQVYLSLKMSIAKEMGSERLPMILDDILVRFDETRRKGACAAITEFAKDQQVFLFSCDSSLPEDFPADAKFGLLRLKAGRIDT